jgi:hypothetical protein
MKEDEMGGVCSMHGKYEEYKILVEEPDGRDQAGLTLGTTGMFL